MVKCLETGSLAIVAALTVLAPAPGWTQDGLPVRVFVTSIDVPPLPILSADQHWEEFTRTKNLVSSTRSRLLREYGDKSKSWPVEAWDQLEAAEDAHALAGARADYQPPETRTRLNDSVADVVRDVGKSKVLTLVTSADEAELVVQITGRRRTAKDASAMFDNNHFVRFRLVPGPKADADRVLEAMRRHEWNRQTTKGLARPRGEARFADLEAGSPYSMKGAGEWVSGMVERFAREQLTPARSKDRSSR